MILTLIIVILQWNSRVKLFLCYQISLIVRLNQAIPTGTTTTLPIVFTSGGGNPQRLTGFNGADITVAQISGTGIYLCWFEHTTNTLQLLTGIA